MVFRPKPYTILDAQAQASDIDDMFEDLYRQLTLGLLGTGVDAGFDDGDVLYFDSTTKGLDIGTTAGAFLRTTGTLPAWSALILPNAATIGDLPYASAANTMSMLAGVATGNALISGGVATAPSWGKVNLNSSTGHVTGTLLTTSGGTGFSSYAVGDLLTAGATTLLSKIADVATGNALISGGIGVIPSWGKIGLTTHVTGTLPIANGGTNNSSAYTAGSIIFSNGTALTQDNTNLFWDDTNNTFVVGGVNLFGNDVIFRVMDVTRTSYFDGGIQTGMGFFNTSTSIATLGVGGNAVFKINAVDGGSSVARVEYQSGGTTIWYVGTNEGAAGAWSARSNGAVDGLTISVAGNVAVGKNTLAFPSVGTAGLIFGDGTALSSMGANTAGLYADDVSTVVKMFAIDEAGNTGQVPMMTGTPVQGDILYGATATLSRLAKDANATRYLSNTGASNDPAWAQVNLANGVTGDLPYANLTQATGASLLLGRGSAAGGGDWQEVTVGSGLTMSATTLSANAGGTNALLDGTVHTDTVAQGVTRGSLIYGNVTPKWDELVIGLANRVLRSDGTDVGWAQVALASDVTGDLPFANIAQIATGSLLGRNTALTGDIEVLTTIPSGVQDNITRTGTLVSGATGAGFTLALGTSTLTGDLPFANLTQGSALSVLGVTGNATADVASIAAGTDNQVLRRSGIALAFGAVNLASANAITGDLPDANLSANVPLLNTVNVYTAFGTHGFVAGGSGDQVFQLRNTTGGAGNATRFDLGNGTDAQIAIFGTGPTTGGSAFSPNDSMFIQAVFGGGLTLGATNASAVIRFFAGNTSTIRDQINSDGTRVWSSYGAGTATFDASGNITSVSDLRAKEAIQPYVAGLAAIRELRPIKYRWTDASGLDPARTYVGFGAQKVLPWLPDAVDRHWLPDEADPTAIGRDEYSLNTQVIIAALVNAVQELEVRLDTVDGKRAPSPRPVTDLATAIALDVTKLRPESLARRTGTGKFPS